MISADDNLTMTATALATADNDVDGYYLGASYADSEPTASLTIGSNASITAGGAVDMEATTTNNLDITVEVIRSPNSLSVSYAECVSNASVQVDSGATIQGASAQLIASDTNTFTNSAKGGGGSKDSNNLGVSIAISDFQSNATTNIAGSVITTSGDALIDAHSNNTQDQTKSTSAVTNSMADKAGGVANGVAAKLQEMERAFAQKIGNYIVYSQSSPYIALAAGIAIVEDDNLANVTIASTGEVISAGNLTIQGEAYDGMQASAEGSAGSAQQLSVGGGIVYANLSNQTNATVSSNAVLKVAKLLQVLSTATIPSPIPSPFESNTQSPSDTSGTGTDQIQNGYTTGTTESQQVLAFMQKLEDWEESLSGSSVTTTFATSDGTVKPGDTAGISGDIDVFTADNSAVSTIGSGAQINQNYDPSPSQQSVEVDANTSVLTIDMAGQASLGSLTLAGASGGSGFGGSIAVITYNNTDQAVH